MKLTNAEILNVKEPLQQLIGIKFPVKVSLELTKLAHKLSELLIPLEQVKDGLVNTYGKTPENQPSGSKSIKPGDENFKAFFEEYSELIAQEVEIDINPVSLPDTFEIEPAVLMALEKFVTV